MATSTFQKMYVTEWVTKSTADAVAAGGYTLVTIDITKAGYTAIGIVGVNKSTASGDDVTRLCVGNLRISTVDPTTCSVVWYNPTSGTLRPRTTVCILYERA